MCGIFGFVAHANSTSKERLILLDSAMKQVARRGSDGTGLLLIADSKIEVHKSFFHPRKFMQTREYKTIKSKIKYSYNLAFFVQGRLATSGVMNLENQHPLCSNKHFFFHNGIYIEEDNVDKNDENLSDSWVLFSKFNLEFNLANQIDTIKYTSENSFVLVDCEHGKAHFRSNVGSLFVTSRTRNLCYFGSEPAPEGVQAKLGASKQIVGSATLDIPTASSYTFSRYEMGIDKYTSERPGECLRCGMSRKLTWLFEAPKKVCVKCDRQEVAQKAKFRDFEELRTMLQGKRVVVGFSGGRDSSFGLLKLREIPNIELIAVSYDWGGVTDVGRRNQSRVCGKLGVEHVWVSADLESKRKNVQKNLLAWSKRPSLATLPILMAGDKAMWKIPHIIATKRKADYVVYCTNPLERTDFKVMLTGAKSRSKSTKPQELVLRDRISLLFRYAKELLKNPYLINSTIWENLWAFKFYFFDGIRNLQIYDYLTWNESEIDEQLKTTFDWENPKHRSSTWRNGDITAPYYNYAYHETLGFSEFDALRANQVRCGQISISESRELLKEDNVPDWKGINEYSNTMGVPVLTLMRAVEKLVRNNQE